MWASFFLYFGKTMKTQAEDMNVKWQRIGGSQTTTHFKNVFKKSPKGSLFLNTHFNIMKGVPYNTNRYIVFSLFSVLGIPLQIGFREGFRLLKLHLEHLIYDVNMSWSLICHCLGNCHAHTVRDVTAWVIHLLHNKYCSLAVQKETFFLKQSLVVSLQICYCSTLLKEKVKLLL